MNYNGLCICYAGLILFLFLGSRVISASTSIILLHSNNNPTGSIEIAPTAIYYTNNQNGSYNTVNSTTTLYQHFISTRTSIHQTSSSVGEDLETSFTATPSFTIVTKTAVSLSNRTSQRVNTGRPPVKNMLSSFGISMIVIGGILVTFMVGALVVICCRGRERGPEGSHTPHSNVKMKPWKSADISTTNEITEEKLEDLDDINHPQSHQNSGLANSPLTSPNSTLAAPANNNTISTTESFRTLQTNSHGDFGRKLSLGRQAYQQTASSEESATGHEPAIEAKGEPDDLTIHYV